MSSDKQESRREIAERVVIAHVNPFTSVDMKALTVAIQAALKERDERAARIADNRAKELRRMATAALLDDETATQFKTQADACDKLAVTIRNEDTNA